VPQRATIGKFSAHKESNDNGTRLVNFAASANMVVGSTLFPRKLIHKATRRSPDGATQNQIDHILRDSRHCSDLFDTRSYRGADIDSDHLLKEQEFRAELARCTKGRI
jgi:hypothetical protein